MTDDEENRKKQVARLIGRWDRNVQRAFDMMRHVAESPKTSPGPQPNTPFENDVFRMAIVFVFAALDDFLRSVGRLRYPRVKGELLKDIPLPGQRETKFNLPVLANYDGLTVRDLVQQSVDAYFSRRTFNSTGEIVGYLRDMKLDVNGAGPALPWIDEMMRRRHRIVHTADLDDELDSKSGAFNTLDAVRILYWIDATRVLVFHVVAALAPDLLKEKSLAEAQACLERFRTRPTIPPLPK
jgi:hypothetical protein